MQKILNMIGLATRAGKVIAGEELVVMNLKRIKLVFLASDAGPNTTKKVTTKCGTHGVLVVRLFSRDELSNAIGKNNRVVCGIKDVGFTKALKKLLEEVTE